MREFRELHTELEQSIFDIALQEYGTIEGVFLLMEDNPEAVPNLDAHLPHNTTLKIRNAFTTDPQKLNGGTVENQDVLALYKPISYKVRTGEDPEAFAQGESADYHSEDYDPADYE